MELINMYMDCMIDGMGSINLNGIQNVLEMENKDDPICLFKILTYLRAGLAQKSEDLKGNGK
jgi:hypothetical protein